MRFVFLKQQHKILIVSTRTLTHSLVHRHTAECIVDFWKSDKSNRGTRRKQQKRIEKQINGGEDSMDRMQNGSDCTWQAINNKQTASERERHFDMR